MPKLFGIPSGAESAIPIMIICPLGGLLVGLVTRYSRVQLPLLAEAFEEFTETGRIVKRNDFIIKFRELIGLLFGDHRPGGAADQRKRGVGGLACREAKIKGSVVSAVW